MPCCHESFAAQRNATLWNRAMRHIVNPVSHSKYLMSYYHLPIAGEGDYTPLMQVQVTFNQGESTKTVTLITLDDVPAEGLEYLEATLDVVDPRVTVSTANATVFIRDDGE